MPKNRTTTKKPPEKLSKSRQYDLFSTFFGEVPELSNTIELWDAIPKYAVSARMQNNKRNADGRLPVYEQSFVYSGRYKGKRIEKSCRIEVHPTLLKTKIKDEKGKYIKNKKSEYEYAFIDFYPSADEELVEEIIKKIFTDQQCGIHDSGNTESWVRFSLQMIRKELKARGKARSIDEIKRSIDILSTSVVRLYEDGDDTPIYTNPILTDVTRVNRKLYLTDGSLTWVAKLPALVSKSVNELTYRQFNYGVLMSLSTQLARWLHKRLSHNYTNASFMDNYGILFTSIQRDSGLLAQMRTVPKSKPKKQVPNTSANIKLLEAAFDELKVGSVLHSWERLEERREGRKIVDVKYSLHAHSEFIKEVKAANKRLKDSREMLFDASVDKSLVHGR